MTHEERVEIFAKAVMSRDDKGNWTEDELKRLAEAQEWYRNAPDEEAQRVFNESLKIVVMTQGQFTIYDSETDEYTTIMRPDTGRA